MANAAYSTEESVRVKIEEMIRDTLKKPDAELWTGSQLAGIGLDSLDIGDLLMKFEDEFVIKLPEEEAKKVKTLGEMITLVWSKVSA